MFIGFFLGDLCLFIGFLFLVWTFYTIFWEGFSVFLSFFGRVGSLFDAFLFLGGVHFWGRGGCYWCCIFCWFIVYFGVVR